MRWWGERFIRELPPLTVEALGVTRMWHGRPGAWSAAEAKPNRWRVRQRRPCRVFLWLGVFGLARLATVVACPLPAVLSGVPALLAQRVGVAGVHVRGCPLGPTAQGPCLKAGEDQESVDPEQDYRCDDDVLPPHCESPLAEDVTVVLPEAAVFMHAWVR